VTDNYHRAQRDYDNLEEPPAPDPNACPECLGEGVFGTEPDAPICTSCNGSGVTPNRKDNQ
jgi:hypothetical protein